MISSRRSFLTGLGAALITAPAIVRAGSLMPVKQMIVGIDLASGLDTTGFCFIISTPHGHSHFYDWYVQWEMGKETSWTPKT